MKPNWTSGPWHASQAAAGFADIRDSRGRLVFAVAHPSTICNDPPMSAEEKEANLHLCASAPELYEALEALVAENSDTVGFFSPHQQLAKLALAKARGKRK